MIMMRLRCHRVLMAPARRHQPVVSMRLPSAATDAPRHAVAASYAAAAAPLDSGSHRHVSGDGGAAGKGGAWRLPPTSTREIQVELAKEAVAEASNSGTQVLRAKAAAVEASKTAADIAADEYDVAALSELGLMVDPTTTGGTGGAGTFYLRIHCRLTNPPGPPSPPNVSTHTAKTVLGECGLPIDSFKVDHGGECVVVVTPPDTAEALVLATVDAIIKSNGAVTFGHELPDPSMLRVLLANGGDDDSA